MSDLTFEAYTRCELSRQNISQKEIAMHIGVKQSSFSRKMEGKQKGFTHDQKKIIAEVLGFSTKYLKKFRLIEEIKNIFVLKRYLTDAYKNNGFSIGVAFDHALRYRDLLKGQYSYDLLTFVYEEVYDKCIGANDCLDLEGKNWSKLTELEKKEYVDTFNNLKKRIHQKPLNTKFDE